MDNLYIFSQKSFVCIITTSLSISDQEAPTITCPTNRTVSTNSVTWTAPVTFDSIDTEPTVTCSPASGSNFNEGKTLVTCMSADDAMNSVSCMFNVTVGMFHTVIHYSFFPLLSLLPLLKAKSPNLHQPVQTWLLAVILHWEIQWVIKTSASLTYVLEYHGGADKRLVDFTITMFFIQCSLIF